MTSKRIVLAGGSGFLGRSLAAHLVENDYDVVVLTRAPEGKPGPGKRVPWDGKTMGDWAEHLSGARAVVNLAGRSINCRHTPNNRREIIDSRVASVQVVVEAIRQSRRPPQAFVQASALGVYGDAGDRVCDESAPPGDGFTAEVCRRWEEAFQGVSTPRTRRVLLRIGLALGRDGGALQILASLTRALVGGAAGRGRQYMSWIHLADLNRIFLGAIEREQIEGVYNATGPNPVTNAEFMRELRRVLRRPWSPPAPTWAVRIGAWLMRTDASLALTGQRCLPKRFLDQGFEFQFAHLRPCLENLLA